MLIDPFGLQAVTQKASQDLIQRTVLGPSYGPDEYYEQPASVVLLNEEFLSQFGMTWPPSLKAHALVLGAIRQHRPAGVLVDMIFPDQRDDPAGVAALRQEIIAYDKAGIPLAFGRAPNLANPIRNDLLYVDRPGDGAEEALRTSLVSLELATDKESEGTFARQYMRLGSQRYVTAAYWMYEQQRQPLPMKWDASQTEGAQLTMDIIWSNRPHVINGRWVDGPCREFPLLLSAAQALFFPGMLRQGCPYIGTIPARALLLTPGDEDIVTMIDKKTVFYGTDLAGTGDVVITPTHGVLPAVYVHAMAYDNLVTFDGDFKRTAEAIVWVELLLAAAVTIAAVGFSRSRLSQPEDDRPIVRAAKRGLRWILFDTTWFSVTILVMVVLYVFFHLSPLNWVGLAALVLGLSVLVSKQALEAIVPVLLVLTPSVVNAWVLEKQDRESVS